jgi:hypothetical protein
LTETNEPKSAHNKAAERPWRLVPGLGIAQIISWGSLYYGISVLGAAIGADLALSPTAVFGAFSLGLLLSGLAAPLVGRSIDRYGGRRVLVAGSLIGAAALYWLSRATSTLEYYAAWCVAGIAMAMILYDAAFATLSQHFGASYRTALTALTLFGGFASTVFWPLAQQGLVHFGWRDTLAAFAALQVLVCLPVHAFLIPGGRGHSHAEPALTAAGRAMPSARSIDARFVALAAAFALNAFVFSAMSAHMIGVMRGNGLSGGEAVWIAALIGPMQVAGRIIEITIGRNLRAVTVAVIAFGLLIVALLVFVGAAGLQPGAAVVFAVLYGLSNGVMTIVRGTAPAEFFGRYAYGSLLGRLAAPSQIAKAIAPVALASLAAPQASPQSSLLLLLLLAVLSLALFFLTIRLKPGALASNRGL